MVSDSKTVAYKGGLYEVRRRRRFKNPLSWLRAVIHVLTGPRTQPRYDGRIPAVHSPEGDVIWPEVDLYEIGSGRWPLGPPSQAFVFVAPPKPGPFQSHWSEEQLETFEAWDAQGRAEALEEE